jgi:hypothetical protein
VSSTTRDNSGALFKNDRKEKETHADYRGSLTAAGVEYWLDAWLNKDKNGNTYLGVKVKPKDAPAEPATRGGGAKPNAKGGADLADDIPFAAETRA